MTPQTQFTPGPWYVQDSTRNPVAKNRHLLVSSTPKHISTIAQVCRRIGMDEEDRVNARLIASAPSLYAALQKMVEAYDALRETTGYREIGTSDCTAGAWLETQFGGISAHAPINMAREALAMGGGGGLGSSTPR